MLRTHDARRGRNGCRAYEPGACCEPLEGRRLLSGVLALTDSNSLVEFDSATPGTIQRTVPIAGLNAMTRVLAIDVRPADGRLYGFFNDGSAGAGSGVCDIDPWTGAASNFRIAGPNVVVASPTTMDFDSISNQLRVLSDPSGSIKRYDVTATSAALVGSAVTPPNHAGAFVNDTSGAGGASVKVFTLDTVNDEVRRFATTEGSIGTESVVGALGVDAGTYGAMDLDESGQTVAVLSVGGVSRYGVIDTSSGVFALSSVLGNGTLVIRDIAAEKYTAPAFTSFNLHTAITDKQTAQPLTGLGITWIGDPAQAFALDVTVSPPEAGAFTAASLAATGFVRRVDVPNGYRFMGSAAQGQAAARRLVFAPAQNLAAVGQVSSAFLAFALADGVHPQIVAGGASVAATSVNDAPTSQGGAAFRHVNVNQTIRVFRATTIADVDPGQRVTVSVQLNTATKGFFTAANLAAAGFTKVGPKKIRFNGTAAAATAALRVLRFGFKAGLPTSPAQSVNLTLRVFDTSLSAPNRVVNVALNPPAV